MKLKIEIADRQSEEMAASLNSLLTDERVLSMRTREAFRNVIGSNFSDLRKLFEYQHESLDAIVVDVSQRNRALEQLGHSTIQESLEATRLTGHNERFTKQDQIIEALLDDHETIIHELTNCNPDATINETDIDTAEFIAGLLKLHEEMIVALRDWL
ncbi:MAG: ferritin-like domain-containing protein [Candidatus Kryptoniota bacterium]